MRSVLIISTVFVSACACCLGRTIGVAADGSGEFASIQAAIDAAQPHDIIVLADGRYVGSGNCNITFKGKAITVRSENGPEACIIDCQNMGRGFVFEQGEGQSSVLEGVTVRTGVGGYAGAIDCASSPVISNCRFTGNRAAGPPDRHAGDTMRITGSPLLVDCLFVDEFSDVHPNIVARDGKPVFERCRFVNSGILIGWEGGSWQAVFRRCFFDIPAETVFQWAVEAHISQRDSTGKLTLENSIFVCQNGVYLTELTRSPGVQGSIRNNVFVASNPGGGDGILYRMDTSNPSVTGNIITGFERGIVFTYAPNFQQRKARITYNDVWGNTHDGWMSEGDKEINLSSFKGHICAAAQFVDRSAGNYALKATSPCIDAGDPMFVAAAGQTDYAGNERVVDADRDGNAVVDIGAYEFKPQNEAPVADAGEDLTVYAWIDGVGEALLNGSGSYDADGDALSYRWLMDGLEIGASETNAVNLEAGEYVITLEVSDGLDVGTDDVVVRVVGAAEAALKVIPRVINRASKGRIVVATLQLPAGVGAADIDREYGVVLEPGAVAAGMWRVAGSRDGGSLFAIFNRDEVIDALGTGQIDVAVVFRLVSGRYVYGTSRVQVIDRGHGAMTERKVRERKEIKRTVRVK